MAVDKKNRIKRAVLTWLCVAALGSGAVPDSFSGYVPTLTMTAAAEDQQTYVSEIDLQQIVNYDNGTTAIPDGVSMSSNDSNGYTLWIEQSGTYKLKGSNYINKSYVDVTIRCSGGVNATIICDDVYIKNDYGYHGYLYCGQLVPSEDHSFYYIPFYAAGSTMTISGNVTVETYYCPDHNNYSAPLTYGDVTGSFFTVTYKDANGDTLGRTHYLSGSTYSDKSGITDGKCLYTMDGEGKKTAFSPTTITSDITVYCADDHSFGEDGVCTVCGVKYEIDLTKLPEYEASGGSIFDGKVSVELHDNNGSLKYYISFNETGSYIIKGRNYINECYCDVQFTTQNGAYVTLVCDDVYIKNDDGISFPACGGLSGPCSGHDSYSVPFDANGSTMTISGNVAVETYFCQNDNYSASLTYGNVNGSFFTVTYEDANGNTLGRTHYLSGGTYSDKSGITDGKCAYTMDGTKKVPFDPTNITAAATVICADHSLDASSKCQNCGAQFRKVTVDDGINTPSTHRVADNNTFDRPADPTAPLGKKFAGWYVGDTKYDFSTPVTSDITVTAHYEDSLIKSVALAPTSNVKDEYIEGNTFDPTGLVITVTYEDDRTEDITYNASNTKFSFSLLTADLATTDKIVTVSYGTDMDGVSNCVDIPITVAAKQLSGIAVKTAPTKTAYTEGNKFDPTGLVITASYDNGKSEDIAYSETSGITFEPTAALTTADTKVTITYGGKTAEQSITVSKKSSGGSSGGSSRPSSPTTPTSTNPVIGGSAKSWSDVAADLAKLTNGSETTIELNGNTTVPVDVIKSIADKDSKITLAIDSTFAWVVDGSKIITPAEADLTFIKTASTKSNGLRGTEGTQFKMNNTGVPTSLEISFKTEHAGKFANLYKNVSGKLTFVTCAKIGADGKVILPDVTEKGDYVAMLCEFSDRLGDMDNDGVMNAKDASAILKDMVEIEPGKNPLMADFNGDGKLNAMDAAAILKRIVGLA